MISIREASSEYDEKLWDHYILSKPESNYCELIAWRNVLKTIYGIKSRFILAMENDEVVGVVQVFINRSILIGYHAVSGPLSSSGGGFYYNSQLAKEKLQNYLGAMVRKDKLSYLLLRLRKEEHLLNWSKIVDRYVTFIMNISGGKEKVWKKVLRAKTRNQIRKALSFKFKVKKGHNQINAFSYILHKGIKELGSPTPGLIFFDKCVSEYGKDIDFIVIYDGNQPIAGTVLFYHKNTVANPWATSLRAYRSHCANSLLYWEIICAASKRGAKYFDLGRSEKESGTYKFKKRLGAEEKPLFYYYILNGINCIPIANPAGKGQVYRKLIWTRIPDFITRPLGHLLLKQIV